MRPLLTCLTTFLVLGLAAGCESPSGTPDDTPLPTETDAAIAEAVGVQLAKLPPEIQHSIVELRKATSPLHNLDRAMEAGFNVDLTGCLENPPIGGMGHHYGFPARIDGAPPVAAEPEILVFSPKANGKLQLGAVEYVVPFGAWTADAPPSLHGQSFHRNEGAGLWVLHVWLWNHNPDGLFADWNPTVSCP
jgi:hypothetical protein